MATSENEKLKKELLTRLKTVKGHIEGVERMVEEDKDCQEVLIQLSAIKSSLNKIGLSLLENDACQCIAESIREEEDLEVAVKETLDTVLKFTKKD
ncbi:metal-sensitive transcriptional regulator [Halanaerocella petrolearia]